ncbi:MAG: hypothetical protein BGO70_01210 [Bacteroidetes bacterium 43-93]|uniref:ImmA/IrrE family metallo-endopeptidase n=1 Tax=uncultured Dysgonomonas sp. TaxID=206096 RepID=UPI000928EBB0|nr:ImmA/IrrE family metallo-endopeptidase [uncultured Dysgonomonas sp.]MBN9483105.1 ImmA/IrrE family metallo-endopeptidase [Bacteroidota bacterium]OJW96331.1 MAG: hypothetical protein BGO70_01210 [Bacteroidetes bacterium 43-93]
MASTRKEINDCVTGILQSLKINSLPVRIEDIAKSMGLQVISYPFTEDISGTLIVQNNIGIIGFNQFESKVRRRFTIAHELGHFMLHRDYSDIFLDKQYNAHVKNDENVKQYFRVNNPNETITSQALEQQANAFAAAILMPEELLRNQVAIIDFDFGSEEAIKYLARIFDVSTQAMSYRLANLGIFDF